MKSRWPFVFAALALGALGFWLTKGERRGADVREAPEPGPGPAPEPDAALAEAHVPAADTVELAEAERTAVEPVAPAVEPDPDLAEIRGRFVLPDGTPAAGVAFEVNGWQSNDEDVRKYGLPEHWEDRSGETDADGRFSVRFEPPRAYQFTFEAKAAGHAGAEWRWGEIRPGAVVDLGAVELVRGGTIEGRIVDEQGNPRVGQQWLVYARSVGLGEFDGRDETQVIAEVDPATASYRAEDVMPGRVELEGYTWPARWVEHGTVQVRSGETLTVDIVDAAPEVSRIITLEARSKWLRTVVPEAEHVTLVGADGVPRSPKSMHFSLGPFVFDELEPGEYTLAVDDPRFRPWSRTARPGAEVEAELEGTSALALRVLDGAGATVAAFSARFELRNVSFSPRDFEVSEAALRSSQGVVAGLTAGDYRVTVRAGEELGAVDVEGLAAGETRAIEVRVGSQSVLTGRVRYSYGEPAVEVEVALLPATASTPHLASMPVADRVMFDHDVQKSVTGEDGRFRFAIARPGEYLVHASSPNGSEALSEVLALAAGAGRDGLELVLPRGGFVVGRILAPPGASCAGLRAWIGPADPDSIRSLRLTDETARELGPDGRFEIGPVPPGPSKAYLLLPEQRRRMGRGLTIGAGRYNRIELGTLEVVDGERVEHDFEVTEFPGTVVLTVQVNGEAVAGLGVELSMTVGEQSYDVVGETDMHGRFGPTPAFAGSWQVQVHDPDVGWRYAHPDPVLVAAASETRAVIQVQVTEARLRFLDAQSGEPLANRAISLLGPPSDGFFDSFPWLRRETDAEGWASWRLAVGDYRFRLEPPGEEPPFFPVGEETQEEQRVAPVVWTLDGPLAPEVRL